MHVLLSVLWDKDSFFPAHSILWLLLVWRRKEPWHQQPLYWTSSPDIFRSSTWNINMINIAPYWLSGLWEAGGRLWLTWLSVWITHRLNHRACRTASRQPSAAGRSCHGTQPLKIAPRGESLATSLASHWQAALMLCHCPEDMSAYSPRNIT